MDSIIQHDKRCYICGSVRGLQCHHIVAGVPGRKNSEKYGLKVWLCMEHHTGNIGVHQDINLDRYLKRIAQTEFENRYSHEKWMEVFGRNYL